MKIMKTKKFKINKKIFRLFKINKKMTQIRNRRKNQKINQIFNKVYQKTHLNSIKDKSKQ